MTLREDAVRVARIVLHNPVKFGQGDYSSFGWSCKYCMSRHLNRKVKYLESFPPNDWQHATSCVVLVARDLLT